MRQGVAKAGSSAKRRNADFEFVGLRFANPTYLSGFCSTSDAVGKQKDI
jgi:hypothetical protein